MILIIPKSQAQMNGIFKIEIYICVVNLEICP